MDQEMGQDQEQEKEAKTFTDMLGIAQNATNKQAEYDKALEFLLSSKFFLYDARNQEYALMMMYSSVKEDMFKKLEEKIKQINKDIRAHMPEQLKELGVGGFGCVVGPALPNRVGSNWVYSPNNVTKLYFKDRNARKAIDDAATVYGTLKNDGHAVTKQARYLAGTLPETIRKQCRISPQSIVSALKMPNLGISINHIANSAYTSFRAFPVPHIFRQFLKLCKQVAVLKLQGLVHGDIRETNVMANPKTGALTLIDFDWLMPKDTFFREYRDHLGFYNNPPESLLHENVRHYIQTGRLYVKDRSVAISTYIAQSNQLDFRSGVGMTLTYANLHDANISNLKWLEATLLQDKGTDPEKKLAIYYNVLNKTFDSYGLGFTLLEFCIYVYPYGASMKSRLPMYNDEELAIVETSIKKLYVNILLPMIALRIDTRLSIEGAYDRLRQLIEHMEAELRSLSSNNLERLAKREEYLEAYTPRGSKRIQELVANPAETDKRTVRKATRKGKRKAGRKATRTSKSKSKRTN